MSNKIKRLGAVAAFMLAGTNGAMATPIFSSGFEMGPDAAEVEFGETTAGTLGWSAAQTDGERFKSSGTKQAYEGDFYASLLQNAGGYDNDTDVAYEFGRFDRIYTVFNVNPNTTYDVSFAHAGANRFGYTADTSVVDVVSSDSSTVFAHLFFDTPDFFDWMVETFQFTTDANTTSVAVAFTVMGLGNASGVFDALSVSVAGPDGTVPVPAALPMMGTALGAGAWLRRRKAKAT